MGKTPLNIPIAIRQHHLLQVKNFGFLPFECKITPNTTDTIVINTILEGYSGSICVFTENDQSTIKIDGRERGKGRIDSLNLDIGYHEVRVYDPSFQRETSSSVYVKRLDRLSIKAEYNIVSVPMLFCSFMIPGYAQICDKYYFKGVGFSLAGIGSIALILSEYSKYSTAEQDYKTALNNYDRSTTEIDLLQNKNIADRQHDEYQVMKKRIGISIGIIAFVWIGNALDVAFNHFLTDRIEVISDVDVRNYKHNLPAQFRLTFALGVQ